MMPTIVVDTNGNAVTGLSSWTGMEVVGMHVAADYAGAPTLIVTVDPFAPQRSLPGSVTTRLITPPSPPPIGP